MRIYVRSAVGSTDKSPEFSIGENGTLYKYNGSSKIVYVPTGVKNISDGAFKFNKTVQKVVLPEGLKNIYYDAFYSCESLKSIVFPSSLRFIGADAFSSCSSLEQVSIPAKVTQLYNRAFDGCTNLKVVKFVGNSIIWSIGKECFADCTSLTTIHLPDSVESIGSYAFYNCKKLKDIRLPNIRILKNVFEGSGISLKDIKDAKLKLMDEQDEQDEDQSIEEWYMGSSGEVANDKFAEKLEDLVRNEFDVSDYFEEPSIQGFAGTDNINITLQDGREYSFSFTWSAMQENIYSDGPESAANYYFNEIKEGIDSGSALVEDTPTL